MPDAALVWKEIEDVLIPRLALSVIDRAIYAHLLRHSRLEGKPRIRFSVAWLARGARLSNTPTRQAVRRLLAVGALRLVERSKAGHIVEVRLPSEIRAARLPQARLPVPLGTDLEDLDFLQTKALRQSIHSREHGRCFYCLCRLTASRRCLDHVVPRVELGANSYRNLVSCCLECNSRKAQTSAADFLRWLYREGRLTAPELSSRLGALRALASGKLLPPLATGANPRPRKGRPPLTPQTRLLTI